jgi:NADH-quinone oxidoreductase E subunit
MHTRYFQAGGLAEDIPPGFFSECRRFVDVMEERVDEYEDILSRQAIWLERTKGIGLLSADDALALGQSGPVLRASGVDWDLRKSEPYLAYDQVDFNVPVYPNGDVYDRYKVHMDEMRESTRIVQQALDGMPEGPWIVDDRKIVLPPRHELHTSMESLIHHFKLVTEGYRVPEGEVYVAVESARGELGCYLVSDVGPKPWRRAVARRPRGHGDMHERRPRRRPDRHRRLPRHGHGRGRPVSSKDLYKEIQKVAAQYPVRRSAVMPALRLAQEKYGWLPPEAFREVADALDLTPAYCEAIASFYDMFHLEPVGRHMIEVCTNVSCALVGAQQVLEAFEDELGIHAGETSEDGEFTLRTVECAGGCGWATVVAVDHRYREPVQADDVPSIVAELRGG